MSEREAQHHPPTFTTSTTSTSVRAGGGATSSRLPSRPSSELPPAAPSDVQAALAVQLKESAESRYGFEKDPFGLATAQEGIAGAGTALPFVDSIQASFGRHDVSGVEAHVGGKAAMASDTIGAEAYATGNHVAFKRAPDLHTAAHEAAHVVQQRGGVQLKGGVGDRDDPYERHADAVADKVVLGESAEALLDTMSGGGSSAAVQRKASGKDLPELLGSSSPAVAAIRDATKGLRDIRDRTGRIWQAASTQATPAAEACAQLTPLVERTFGYLGLVSAHFSKFHHARSDADANAASNNLLRQGAALSADDELEPIGVSFDRQLPEIFDSLDNIVRYSLLTVRKAKETSGLEGAPRALLFSVDIMSNQAAPLGWTRPENVEEATNRRYAHEACPTGAADERPDVCSMKDIDRNATRDRVLYQLRRVIDDIISTCEAQRSEIQSLIDQDRELGAFIGGLALEALIGAVTGGIGAAAASAAEGAAQGATSEAAKALARKSSQLTQFKQLTEKFGKNIGKAASKKNESAPEQRTVEAIEQLRIGLTMGLEEVADTLRAYDDDDLNLLEITLREITAAQTAGRIKKFVKSYREQIEPIGQYDPEYLDFVAAQPIDFRDLPGKSVVRAARIHPLQGEARLALVRHVTDKYPVIRETGRAIESGVESLKEGAKKRMDNKTKEPADPWAGSGRPPAIDATAEQFYFVRWIDDNMAQFVEAEAIDLPSAIVHGLT